MSGGAESLSPVQVLGIGSPFAPDDIAWRLVEALSRAAPLQRYGELLRLQALDRPGAGLLRYFENAPCVLLLDAVVDEHVPIGELKRYLIADIEQARLRSSSHGFGVAQALSLARALGQLPGELHFWGVAIGNAAQAQTFDWDSRIPELVTPLAREIASICDAFVG